MFEIESDCEDDIDEELPDNPYWAVHVDGDASLNARRRIEQLRELRSLRDALGDSVFVDLR